MNVILSNLQFLLNLSIDFHRSKLWKHPQNTNSKFFIMSMEFDKNISDWRHDCTDYKNDLDFFPRTCEMAKYSRQNFSNKKSFDFDAIQNK